MQTGPSRVWTRVICDHCFADAPGALWCARRIIRLAGFFPQLQPFGNLLTLVVMQMSMPCGIKAELVEQRVFCILRDAGCVPPLVFHAGNTLRESVSRLEFPVETAGNANVLAIFGDCVAHVIRLGMGFVGHGRKDYGTSSL